MDRERPGGTDGGGEGGNGTTGVETTGSGTTGGNAGTGGNSGTTGGAGSGASPTGGRAGSGANGGAGGAGGAGATAGSAGTGGGTGGSGGSGGTTVGGGPGDIKVAYNANDTNSTSQQISFVLRLGATYPRRAPDVTLRYWFTADGVANPVVEIDAASIGKEFVTTTFVSLPTATTTADAYLEIGFTGSMIVDSDLSGNSAAANLLQLRFHGANYQGQYTQSNDYSFDRTKVGTAVLWDHMTAYIGGRLVWGVEPM